VLETLSSRTGALLCSIAPGYVFSGVIAAGDQDGDGFEDVLVDRGPSTPFRDTRTWLEMDLLSGRTGEQLRHFEANLGEDSETAKVAMLGDFDSDGRRDVVVSSRAAPRADMFTILSSRDASVLAVLESPTCATGEILTSGTRGLAPLVFAGSGTVSLLRIGVVPK
jgi:hypothetical protein